MFIYPYIIKYKSNTIDISPDAKKLLPTWEQRHRTEAGLLVKAAQLPSFSSTIETRKQYNRVKHVHTKLDYQPVNITFHDDNMGITTALMEMYYRYYYADGNYGMQYAKLVPILINAVKELSAEVEQLKSQLNN